MKKYSILLFVLCLSFQLHAQKHVVISEVMYDSPLNEQIGRGIPYSNGEYIELWNLEETTVNLSGWKLTGGGSTEIYEFPAETLLPAKSPLVVAYQYNNSGFSLYSLFPWDGYAHEDKTLLYQRKLILANSGETVSLIDPTGTVVDYITYDGTSHKTKPDRLSAENEDGNTGGSGVSLQRVLVHYAASGNILFEPSNWAVIGYNPFEWDPRQPIRIVDDGPSQNEHYIVERTHTASDEGTEVVTYYDDFGRLAQTIAVGASPVDGRSIVSFVEYDEMGRADSVSYLPYVADSQSALIRTDPLAEQQDFYGNRYTYDHRGTDGNHAYATKQYDDSGLGLALEQGAPGRSGQEHPTRHEYGMNSYRDAIATLSIDPTGTLVGGPHYRDHQLTVKTTIQPTEGNKESVTKEFYDSEERLVAQQQFGDSGADPLTTYYVYDELGRQRCVVPPSVGMGWGWSLTFQEMTETCFYTEYDEYGRVSKKYVPGASPVTYLYDKRGRLAMSQDGEQAKTGEWSFVKYDIYDRAVMSGVYHSAATYEDHKAALAVQTVFGETFSSASAHHEYTNVCYPTTIAYADVLNVQYYDDYEAVHAVPTYDYQQAYAADDTKTDRTKGLLTVTKSKVLDSQASTPQWLTTVNYYDDKYRVIQSIGDLYPGGREIVSNGYDYSGNLTGVWLIQETVAGWQEYKKWFDYDLHGRLLAVRQSILGDSGMVTVAGYTYDELGRVKQKKLHNGTEPVAYSYNIAGANTGSNSSLFSYHIYSNLMMDQTPPRYDGKPAFFEWWRSDGNDGGYRYTYDDFGRIEHAQYVEYSVDDGEWIEQPGFTERGISYDENGNIRYLLRTDANGASNDMELGYNNRNQLEGIRYEEQVFMGYTYDANGNLTYDPLRGTTISYNSLNLPEEIIANNGNIRYIYSADGVKLASVAGGSFTYYRSTMVYGGAAGGEQLQYVMHPEGVATKRVSGGFDWQYHLTDYMGNVRTVALADVNGLVPIQSTDYYAFGLAHGYENLHLNRYLFSGKELQDANVGDLGFLGLYDYGARFYDPILGRWHNIDPALQTTNPYLFCGNAPMVYVDKDGRFFWWIVAAAAVVGAYMGGSAANNDWNLFQWDWSSWSTWGGMLGGAVQGALAGASLGYGISALTGPIFAASKFSTMGTILRFTSLGFSGIKTVATGASLITNFSDGMDIVRGNYAYSSKTFGGKWLQGLLRATWEKPQQYLGYTYAQLRNGFDPDVDVRYFHGAVVINKPGSKTNQHQGVTLGNMINGWGLDSDEDPMLLHEYGHTIQGRWFGLLYLPLIGAPSLISSSDDSDAGREKHSNRWYEKQANRLARDYFGEDYWYRLTSDDKYPTRKY